MLTRLLVKLNWVNRWIRLAIRFTLLSLPFWVRFFLSRASAAVVLLSSMTSKHSNRTCEFEHSSCKLEQRKNLCSCNHQVKSSHDAVFCLWAINQLDSWIGTVGHSEQIQIVKRERRNLKCLTTHTIEYNILHLLPLLHCNSYVEWPILARRWKRKQKKRTNFFLYHFCHNMFHWFSFLFLLFKTFEHVTHYLFWLYFAHFLDVLCTFTIIFFCVFVFLHLQLKWNKSNIKKVHFFFNFSNHKVVYFVFLFIFFVPFPFHTIDPFD